MKLRIRNANTTDRYFGYFVIISSKIKMKKEKISWNLNKTETTRYTGKHGMDL